MSSLKRVAVRTACLALAALMVGLASFAHAAEPIKIGAFFALSGPAAFIGEPTKLVAQMVVDKINKEGGINGAMIELVLADTEGEPTKAVMAFKRFVNVDQVVAVIGPTRTGTGMAVKKQVEEEHIPTVMTVGGDPVIMEGMHGGKDFGTARYVFKTPQRSSVAVKKVLGYLSKHGLKKICIVTSSDGFGRDGARWLEKLAPEFGVEVLGSEQFNPKDLDMKTQLTKLAGLNPQAIVCWTIGPAGAIVSKNHHSLGLEASLVQCHGLPGPRYIEQAGAAAEGDLMPATKLMTWRYLPDRDPQKAVMAEFERLYKDVYHYDEKYPINTHSGYAWDALMLLAEAIEKAGPDKEKIRDALEATKDHVGISGIYTLSPKDHNGLDTDSMVMLEVKNGAFVPVD